MKYVTLGRSGLKVSGVCLGAGVFGRDADEKSSFKLMDRFVELGGNFIDTAELYVHGISEEIIGRWLKQRAARDKVVLATKVFGTAPQGSNGSGLSRAYIRHGVEASLKRLQTSNIDLYQIHRWDPNTPPEETLGALNDLVRSGKVNYLGCSTLAPWQLSKYLAIADQYDWPRFVSIQFPYNALNRSVEKEILPLCQQEGLAVIAYNPLAGGMLTGKYRRGGKPPLGARFDLAGQPSDEGLRIARMYRDRYMTNEAFDIVERFAEFANQKGLTPAQLAMAWVVAEPRVTCPNLGARSAEQFEDAASGLNVKLTPEQRAAIPAVPPGRWVGRDPLYDGQV